MPNRNLNGWTDPLDRSTAGGHKVNDYKPKDYTLEGHTSTPKEPEIPKRLWWGYKHTSGTYQVKPYRESLDIQEANQSPFCVEAVGPFLAADRDEALEIVKQMTK